MRRAIRVALYVGLALVVVVVGASVYVGWTIRRSFPDLDGQLVAQEHRRAGKPQPDLLGDRRRRHRVVAGHHRDLDTSPAARLDRVPHIVARRILEPDETEELQALLALLERRRRAFATGEASNQQISSPPSTGLLIAVRPSLRPDRICRD